MTDPEAITDPAVKADPAELEKLRDMIAEAEFAMLTTISHDNKLVSRPMAVQETEFDGDLWFVFSQNSSQADQLRDESEANASFQTRGTWVSVAGTGRIVQVREKLEQLWRPALSSWFPDGVDTPGVALLKIEAESAQYWNSDGGSVRYAFEMAKARVKGQQPDYGESKKLDF